MLIRAAGREVRSWTTDSRRWLDYKPRAGDVIIGTSVKCGTTWVQQIVSLLIFQTAEQQPLQTLSPWIDQRFAPIEGVQAQIEAQTHRRFLKAHVPADALPLYDEVRYIHVGRDGRDAFMSWHNHNVGGTERGRLVMDFFGKQDETIGAPLPRVPSDAHAYFQTWMTEGPGARLADDFPAARYFDIERSYWAERALPNMLLVHYNDLKADLGGEMRRIAAFLEISVREDLWPSLVEAAQFDFMRANGAALLPRAALAWEKGHETFFNKGTNARWREALTADDIALYDDRVKRELSPALAAWAGQGRLAAGDPREAKD